LCDSEVIDRGTAFPPCAERSLALYNMRQYRLGPTSWATDMACPLFTGAHTEGHPASEPAPQSQYRARHGVLNHRDSWETVCPSHIRRSITAPSARSTTIHPRPRRQRATSPTCPAAESRLQRAGHGHAGRRRPRQPPAWPAGEGGVFHVCYSPKSGRGAQRAMYVPPVDHRAARRPLRGPGPTASSPAGRSKSS